MSSSKRRPSGRAPRSARSPTSRRHQIASEYSDATKPKGRGAVIELDAHHEDEVWLLANNVPIARGEIIVQGEKIAISITSTIKN
ncbi:FliM/FliN family flagellar motor switch protein, partial [Parvibaculum sp.]|uniref:FliM/FliN family flagellar motor switch protein n=1 Tax=Parvibaculum sp. TaxID=2024848 RepID=UPI002B8205A0